MAVEQWPAVASGGPGDEGEDAYTANLDRTGATADNADGLFSLC